MSLFFNLFHKLASSAWVRTPCNFCQLGNAPIPFEHSDRRNGCVPQKRHRILRNFSENRKRGTPAKMTNAPNFSGLSPASFDSLFVVPPCSDSGSGRYRTSPSGSPLSPFSTDYTQHTVSFSATATRHILHSAPSSLKSYPSSRRHSWRPIRQQKFLVRELNKPSINKTMFTIYL